MIIFGLSVALNVILAFALVWQHDKATKVRLDVVHHYQQVNKLAKLYWSKGYTRSDELIGVTEIVQAMQTLANNLVAELYGLTVEDLAKLMEEK